MPNDYLKSIDKRLSRIEHDVAEIREKVAILNVKIAAFSSIISILIYATIRYFLP